jgi:tRNA dimethylallyltransferase
MQVYRRMDIGTAKATSAERAEVPHHCIDLVDPDVDFTVAAYKSAHTEALAEVQAAGGVPLIVGGTGLYHRVVIDDFDLPGEWPAIREELDGQADTAALYERLASLDASGASKIDPSNRRRVVRALEVTLGSGRPFSSFGPGVDSYPPTNVVQIGILRARPVLRELIEQRVHGMIDDGLVDEVRTIATDRGFSRTAAQALGYKEILAHLTGEISQDEAIQVIITRTRQFAVRQERWFRRDPRVRWIDVDHEPVADAVTAVIDAITEQRSR